MFFLCCLCVSCYISSFFFFKQKTVYEMRISDWSSDVCSSDLVAQREQARRVVEVERVRVRAHTRRLTVAADEPASDGVIRLLGDHSAGGVAGDSSEERREGKECVIRSRSWW